MRRPKTASAGSASTAAPADATAGARTGEPAPAGLASRVVAWQRTAGRHDLPWQRVDPLRAPLRDPYRVWLSEVMLQQTQVATATPYFHAFLAAFPTVADLAAAPIERVMAHWSGLGYYSRARNLHAAARQVVECHGGRFPADAATLATLPGVGRSTAAAIAVFAFGERAAILDGNVKRVFGRVFAIDGEPNASATVARLWAHAEAELPAEPASPDTLIAYTQGLMDLGATCCTRRRPACARCPLAEVCVAHRDDAVDRYPAARTRRAVPLRMADLLFVHSVGHVLLQWRPPTGIWGGLQSLPEPAAAAMADWLAGNGLVAVDPPWPMARIDHAFTHFRLQATVWRVDVRPAIDGAPPGVPVDAAGRMPGPLVWVDLARVEEAPLPGPIKRLLLDCRDPMSAPADVAAVTARRRAGSPDRL